MNTDQSQLINTDLLHSDLSYKVRGAIMNVANKYGKGLKESIYQAALAEEFDKLKIKYEQQKRVTIYSVETSKPLGTYVPDFVVEDKIIIEIKATDFVIQKDVQQQLSYLKASKYELGFLANFSTPQLYIKRSIFTNDRKPSLRVHP